MIRLASLFSQLLKWMPHGEFERLVHQHGAEQAAKGFTCWTQFVSMLSCHLAHAGSPREISHGLACRVDKLVHLPNLNPSFIAAWIAATATGNCSAVGPLLGSSTWFLTEAITHARTKSYKTWLGPPEKTA